MSDDEDKVIKEACEVFEWEWKRPIFLKECKIS